MLPLPKCLSFRRIIFIALFLLISAFYLFNHDSNIDLHLMELNKENANFSTQKQLPLILSYNTFFGASFFGDETIKLLKNCKFKCRYSENKKFYPEADVAVFHFREFTMNSMLFSSKNPKRLNVFVTLEAEPNERILEANIPKDFFNVTVTFRKDSTIWRPYDFFEEFQMEEQGNEDLVWTDQKVDAMIAKKTKFALQFVSNCETHSKREKYLEELQKLTNVSVYGKCSNQPFPPDDEMISNEFAVNIVRFGYLQIYKMPMACYEMPLKGKVNGISLAFLKFAYLLARTLADATVNFRILSWLFLGKKHFFYLAFENAVCQDYITEKFWKLKNLIVPIVLKRSILRGIIDDKYFVAADDYNSPKELIAALQNISKFPNEYKKFLSWTKKYKKTKALRIHEFCTLCEMATKKERNAIEDIEKWWKSGGAKCAKNFVEQLIN